MTLTNTGHAIAIFNKPFNPRHGLGQYFTVLYGALVFMSSACAIHDETDGTAFATEAKKRDVVSQFSMTTTPPLFPRFDPTVSDYVIRCADAPLQVSVSASPNVVVFLDGQLVHRELQTQVNVTSGQAFPMIVAIAGGEVFRYNVRCLPADFPAFSTERPGSPQAEWYIAAPFASSIFQPAPPDVSTQYVAVFDNQGVPLWWMKSSGNTGPLDAKLLPNGNIAWLHFASDVDGQGGGAEEHTWDGTLVRALNTVNGPVDHHEIQLLANGNYAMGRYFPVPNVDLTACGGLVSANVTDNEIQEITPDGGLVWSWNALAHIPVTETTWPTCGPDLLHHDVYHFNSIAEDGDAFIVSFRHLDAVYKISRSTGEIVWKLGGSTRPESLAVVGDVVFDAGGSLFGGQHDARVLPDGTLSVYDNRSNQAFRKPRAVRFQIDELARTATLVESVSDADVVDSVCCGSTRKLPTGNWVMAWGANPAVTELAPDGSLVFRINFTQGLFSYRADPIMPGALSRLALRTGMDAQYPRAPSLPLELIGAQTQRARPQWARSRR